MGRQLQVGRWELPSCVICDFLGWQNHHSSPLLLSRAKGGQPPHHWREAGDHAQLQGSVYVEY